MEQTVASVTVECITGDIAKQDDIDAVVNAANAQLRSGGGVAGAIHRAAGPGLAEECRPLSPIQPGQAVLTSAHELPNKHVIHCLGPVFGRDEPSDKLLADCYRNALKIAEENKIESVAFPSISTGAFGYPMNDAAAIAMQTINDMSPHLTKVKRIRFVLFDGNAREIHENAMQQMLGER